ncbi:MAG: protein kinase, partial [Planctomycetota bacterium]
MSDRKAEKKPPDPPPPQRVAHYRLDALVARGGEGVVYRATDTTLDRTVALKIIDDPASAEGLIAEARHVSLLSHPCIAGVHQAGIDPKSGFAFIALEWVQGPTLRKRLRDGPLGIAELCRFGQRIASAVAHAHDKGLIHGDLKADNVVIAGAGASVEGLAF